ncbi:MAG TPA: SDR family NAD(P)-dependent oxidoreductase [Bauldia sp.]|nr:SDR family NAD(P)-dependent oxidoreductase [Bauldia sp.]
MTGRSILITGCSSGIGATCAAGMKARGWRVFATARKEADVAPLAAEGFDALRLDVTDAASIEAAAAAVLSATGGRLDALFHNAGMAQPGALEDLPTEALRAQFETNLFGWHTLTRAIVPAMRAAGRGRIVFCSSVLGFVPARFRGAYVASKYAVEGYADTLRIELAGTGIDVVLIEPGPIRSSFRDNARSNIEGVIDVAASPHRALYEAELAGRSAHARAISPFRLGPEAVLAKLVRAVESPRPRARYPVTVPAHAVAWLKRILPTRLLDRIVRRGGG